MSNDPNMLGLGRDISFRGILPSPLDEICEPLYKFKRDMESPEYQNRLREERESVRRLGLTDGAKKKWEKFEKLEKEGKLPVYLWMIESKRFDEEEGYGVVVWYASRSSSIAGRTRSSYRKRTADLSQQARTYD